MDEQQIREFAAQFDLSSLFTLTQRRLRYCFSGRSWKSGWHTAAVITMNSFGVDRRDASFGAP